MGKKVPDSGIEIATHTTFGFDAILYYGGDTTNTAHTVPTNASGDDVRITRAVFEPILAAAYADDALDAGGDLLEQALKSDNVPPEYGTWWDNMPKAFQGALVDTLSATYRWKNEIPVRTVARR